MHLYAWHRPMLVGTFDSHLYEALKASGVQLEGATAWDVGAHIGYHSLGFAVLVGEKGRVVAFEPNPANVRRIEEHKVRNEALGRRIEVQPLALSDEDGEAEFLCGDAPRVDDIGHLASRKEPADRVPSERTKQLKPCRVRTARADTLIDSGLPGPALMKIDVEGAEGSVLRGCQSMLLRYKPVIVAEIHSVTCMFECLDVLHSAGYRVSIVDDGKRSTSRAFIIATAVAPTGGEQAPSLCG